MLPLTAAISTAAQAQSANQLEPVTVTTTRGNSEAGETPQKITVINRDEIEQQMAITNDQAQVLSNLIPSYSPSRQKLTNSGETFRGRDPLFLIDGIPQSNPLRDGSRDGYTIDLAMVERIEVIHGASAEHGLGAT
ncbi:MAG TPA: TonB-dependent receptor, partial [Alcanivorax sp.]|nr:TonB-dependent receptor [Alcanivorax sp.]